MDAFHFVDIFSTKGIEYLLVIFFILAFVFYWRMLNKPALLSNRSRDQIVPKLITQSGFRIAEGYYYHPGHTWFSLSDNKEIKAGVDEFALKLVGKPDELKLPAKNSTIKQGEKAWSINKDGKIIDMLSPVSGRVVDINTEVIHNPSILSDSPYEKGWLLKVEPDNLNRNMKNMLKGNYARAWLEEAVSSLSALFTRDLGVVMQDGGSPLDGIAKDLDSEKWEEIVSEYFLT